MDFGVTGKPGGYCSVGQYRKNAASGISGNAGFAELAAAKAAEKGTSAAMSFKDMWQAKFPGAYYHVMDGSAISQGAWDRNDFPLEKFFQDNIDESTINWKPTGTEPEAVSSQVQSRWNATLGQKSIIVPPELEEKMKNDPELAKKVMTNVENFIATYSATSVRPGRVCSWLISLDENGEVEKYRVTGGGGNISGPTEEEQRQFEAEQAAKRKRREEYARLNEESALKRKLTESENNVRQIKSLDEDSGKAAAKVDDVDERAFEQIAPNAPEEVKKAWMEAAKETGANGMGIQKNGMLSHISQMMVQRLNRMLSGSVDNPDILGSTVESAVQAAKQALYNLEHPIAYTPKSIEVQRARMKEREFYTAFLEKLKAYISGE